MYDLFASTGGLLDYANQKNERSKQSFDFITANRPYQ